MVFFSDNFGSFLGFAMLRITVFCGIQNYARFDALSGFLRIENDTSPRVCKGFVYCRSACMALHRTDCQDDIRV